MAFPRRPRPPRAAPRLSPARHRRERQISLFDLLEAEPGGVPAMRHLEPQPRVAPIAAARQLRLDEVAPLRLVVLGSGSKGNSVLVESGETRILLDAGFSCREIERRLSLVGVDPASLHAILLTHEHSDHARGVERLVKRHGMDVWATSGTLAGRALRKVRDRAKLMRAGQLFDLLDLRIEPIGLSHDAREPVGLVIEGPDGSRLGLVSDLGARGRRTWERLHGLDILVLESNHDLEMLHEGPYPWYLKRRIASQHGHLSNEDAARGLEELADSTLKAVVLYHLSETNNDAGLAQALAAEALDRSRSSAQLVVSRQDVPSPWVNAHGNTGDPTGE